MLEPRWVRWLSRLLPESTRADLFEPSYYDLQAEQTSAGFRFFAQVCLLVVQSWALTPIEVRRNPERFAMFLYLIRHAFRLLIREPAFTLAAVLTLALGVGANVAVFAVVEAVLLRPFPYPEAGRLVILNHRDRHTGISKQFIAIGDYLDLVQRQTAFESMAAWGGASVTVYGAGEPYRATTLGAGPDSSTCSRCNPCQVASSRQRIRALARRP